MKKAAVGFSVHSGWSAMVAVCLETGSPEVLHREHVHLVQQFTYRLRQPYHTAEQMGFAKAGEFIPKCRATAAEMAERAIHALQDQLSEQGSELRTGALLLASGKPLPDLEKILASHALIHTADGELFRDALAEACSRCGVRLLRVKEKELLKLATQTLGRSSAALLELSKEMGRPFGSPWSRDEKFSALAAWLALRESA